MNTIKFLAMAVLGFFLIQYAGCGKKETKVSEKDKYENTNKDTAVKKDDKVLTTAGTNGKYFCEMHPVQQSDDANARCSVCKMKLSEKKAYEDKMDKKHDELVDKYKDQKNIVHYETELTKIKSDECEKYIKDAIKKDAGIVEYFIDILTPEVHMMYDKNKTSKDKIEKLLTDAGFDTENNKANQEVKNKLPEECR